MPKPHIALAGKAIKKLTQSRGGGSAFPGLFVEKIDPNFLHNTLSQLKHGVVAVSGTNGKTTTTKIVVDLLESQGFKVFTNKTGSNFTRGVVSALLNEISWTGKLDADIAVVELDEAHAVHFVKEITPRYTLLLNVLRDQLDRFGEIDYTASLLHTIGEYTQESIVLNRDDPRLGNKQFIDSLQAPVFTFGVSEKLQKLFPSDDDLHNDQEKTPHCAEYYHDDVELTSIDIAASHATYRYDEIDHTATLKLKGIYNLLNAAGAIAVTRQIMGKNLNEKALYASLENVNAAFGRGETLTVDGDELELVLVKNPSGFRLALASFDPSMSATMVAINDNYADGRDMSWLWDVNFEALAEENGGQGVDMTSGVRAYDMALRLKYDGIDVHNIDQNFKTSLETFLKNTHGVPKRIFCTYTAMLELRSLLGDITDVEEVIS